jgi:putative acetyltransferase
MNRNVKIRSATNHDAKRIVTLVKSILSEYELQFDIETSESDLRNIEATYTNSGGWFAVIDDKAGDLLGTIALLCLDNKTCKLRKLYLVRQARGFGTGRLMIEHAIEAARRLGFKTIMLETVSVLTDAIRLYTRSGFVLVDQEPVSPRCDQVYRLDLVEQAGRTCLDRSLP